MANGDRTVIVLRTVSLVAPPICFLVIAGVLLVNAHLTLGSITQLDTLRSLGTVVLVIAIALVASYGVRQWLLPAAAVSQPALPAGGDPSAGQYRDRLARYVVLGGTLGIAATALAVIVTIALSKNTNPDAIERDSLNVFTTVLPVFATWVGTVLAFYFTNESFRQAAAAAAGSLGNSSDGEPISRPGTMVPYDRVVKKEMTADEITGRDAQTAAGDLKLQEIADLFSPPGIARVVIFDDKKVPVFVIRHDATLDKGKVPEGATLKTYLDTGNNRASARNFAWSASTATITDARRLVELRKVTDIFITQHGLSDEPAIGWVPDSNLPLSSQPAN